VARALARRLGFCYLDTGAMYRAVALAGLKRGVDWDRPEQLARLAEQVRIEVLGDRIVLDGEDVTETVRTAQVTAVTRFAADNPAVRRRLVAMQREYAAGRDIVTEGRDQGTVAFPDAQSKVFLTAGDRQRALRRLRDLEAQGEPATLDRVLADIRKRDAEDRTRPVGALMAAPEAVEVSTDGMSVDEVVDRLEAIVRRTAADRSGVDMSRQAIVQRPLASRVWYAISKPVVRWVATFAYGTRFTGQENVPLSGRLLVVANHQSHLDPPLVGCGFPRRLNYMARKDLFGFGPFRWLIQSFDAIPVDRHASPIAGVRETMRRLSRGEAVLMFPEGTRTPDGEIGTFMPGFAMIAVRSGAAVQPVAIEGAFDVWPRRNRFPWRGTIHIHFGPLIPVEEVQSLGVQNLFAETEKRIRRCHALLRSRPVFARRRRHPSLAASLAPRP